MFIRSTFRGTFRSRRDRVSHTCRRRRLGLFVVPFYLLTFLWFAFFFFSFSSFFLVDYRAASFESCLGCWYILLDLCCKSVLITIFFGGGSLNIKSGSCPFSLLGKTKLIQFVVNCDKNQNKEEETMHSVYLWNVVFFKLSFRRRRRRRHCKKKKTHFWLIHHLSYFNFLLSRFK